MTSRARAVIWTGLVVLAGGVACGGSDSNEPEPSRNRTVIVADVEFQGATVNISPGDTVTWSWRAGTIDHNILSIGPQTFPSYGDLDTWYDAPASYQYVFNSAGTYWYYCSTHGNSDTTNASGMKGKIVVD